MTLRDGGRETAAMDHELICTWLGLPSKCWPPDHYTLLGLAPGETDAARIEHHVHERLARLRCYQISHPGPATEAMNRLAQAFVCLTDPEARKAYNAQFFPNVPSPPAPPPTQPQPAVEVAPAVATLAPPASDPPVRVVTPGSDTGIVRPVQTQVDWRNATPPPVRSAVIPVQVVTPTAVNGTPAAAAPSANGAAPVAQPPAAAPAPPPVSRPVDPVFETARSPEARRGLRTRRHLYERVLLTRRLLRTWERLGRYANKPKRKISRAVEENDLTRLLERADELLERFPPLLGEPGQPGYRVLILAHEDAPVAMFKQLDTEQREALARDWLAGRALLQAHREFLRQEVKRLRRRGLVERLLYPVHAVVNDHPGWVALGLLGVTAAALAVVLVR